MSPEVPAKSASAKQPATNGIAGCDGKAKASAAVASAAAATFHHATPYQPASAAPNPAAQRAARDHLTA